MLQGYLDETVMADALICAGLKQPDSEYQDRVTARKLAALAEQADIEFSFDADGKFECVIVHPITGPDAVECYQNSIRAARKWNVGITLNAPDNPRAVLDFCQALLSDPSLSPDTRVEISMVMCQVSAGCFDLEYKSR